MADRHPYVPAPGNLVKVVTQFRKSFPATVNAETLKKLALAPSNETYVINVLRFLGLIDEEGKKTETASKIFSLHDDPKFGEALSKVLEKVYKELFELHGEGSWNVDTNGLISFFRSADSTTDIVGKRQATTFLTLSKLAGHGEAPKTKASPAKSAKATPKPPKINKKPDSTSSVQKESTTSSNIGTGAPAMNGNSVVGLTVRIEINLPADGDQETYNRIFKSIRENFLNG